MKYYAVTTFFIQTSQRAAFAAGTIDVHDLDVRRPRTVAIYEFEDDAVSCVTGNRGNIYEDGYYSHVAIEKQETGLYPIPSEQAVYEWDVAKEGYVLRFRTKDYKGLFSRIG